MNTASIRFSGMILLAILLPACGVGGGGTLSPTIAPGIPQQVTAVGGNRRVTLTWASSGAGAGYTVLRSQTSGGPYVSISQPGQFTSPTTYLDAGLENGTSYFYVVIAANDFGISAPSAEVAATPAFHPRSLASGTLTAHGLVLFEDGSVWGWGWNVRGETGNGLQGFQFSPAQALNIPKVTALSRGSTHSLALASDGTVWGWGSNTYGQMGDGTVSNAAYLTPLQVPGLSNVTAISAGAYHNLALRSDGTVWAWGSNGSGELGNGGSSSSVNTAAPVPSLTGITAVAGGYNFSLALRNDGTVWAWGNNQWGQIGNGSTSLSGVTSPYQVDNLNAVTDITVGLRHCLVLRSDGVAWAWGEDNHGQLGNGATLAAPVTRPTRVVNLTEVRAISAGAYHSLALRNDETVWTWGDNGGYGILGNGSLSGIVNAPAQVLGLSGIQTIAGGGYFSMALGDDGTVWIWGDNSDGQLGVGGGGMEVAATEINNLTSVAAVGAGWSHSAALRSDGTVWSWGLNQYGQFGNGTTSGTSSSTPTQASVLTGVTTFSAGAYHGLAIRSNGSVWTWGLNQDGQIGNGSASPIGVGVSTPIQVNVLTGVFTKVSGGLSHSLALKSDGTVWAWGRNVAGQVGNGNTNSPVVNPAQVGGGLTGVTAVGAGGAHSMALRNDGTVWVWGSNASGQTGSGSAGATPATAPVQVPGLSGIVAIAAGDTNCMAVKNDGTVWAWGGNTVGQVGNGLISPSVPTPFQVPGLTGMVAVAQGQYFSAALKNDGTVWCWGENTSAELGDGTLTSRTSPVQTLGLSGVTAISSGMVHSLARMPNGLVRGWGANSLLQLGKPLVTLSTTPLAIQQ